MATRQDRWALPGPNLAQIVVEEEGPPAEPAGGIQVQETLDPQASARIDRVIASAVEEALGREGATAVGDVMTTKTLVVAPEDTLGEVAERMRHDDVGSALVAEYGRLIGIVTSRDMLNALADRVHPSEGRVRQWMTAAAADGHPDVHARDGALPDDLTRDPPPPRGRGRARRRSRGHARRRRFGGAERGQPARGRPRLVSAGRGCAQVLGARGCRQPTGVFREGDGWGRMAREVVALVLGIAVGFRSPWSSSRSSPTTSDDA